MTLGSDILEMGFTLVHDQGRQAFNAFQPGNTGGKGTGKFSTVELDSEMDYDAIFSVVKKTVKQVVHRERAGLGLALAELPPTLGAFWEIGGNYIVMNEALIGAMTSLARNRTEFNSFIYSILTHEYLHSVGFIDEGEARILTAKVAVESFGEDHPASIISSAGPWAIYSDLLRVRGGNGSGLKIVSRFDSDSTSYIN
jgi:hypothetical protein